MSTDETTPPFGLTVGHDMPAVRLPESEDPQRYIVQFALRRGMDLQVALQEEPFLDDRLPNALILAETLSSAHVAEEPEILLGRRPVSDESLFHIDTDDLRQTVVKIPGVADALEAFRRESDNDDELSEPKTPLDPELVAQGARWIINHTQGSEAQASAIGKFARRIITQDDDRAGLQKDALSLTSGLNSLPLLGDPVITTAESAAETAETARTLPGLLAKFKAAIENQVVVYEASDDELLSNIFRRLHPTQKEDGTYEFETSGNYQVHIQRLAKVLINRPDLYIHLEDASRDTGHSDPSIRLDDALAAGYKKIAFDVNDTVVWSEVDVTPDLTDRWFGRADRLPEDMTLETLEAITQKDRQWAGLASGILLGAALISNNLARVGNVKSTMTDIVDGVHAVMSKGYGRIRGTRQPVAMQIIYDYLKANKLANNTILYGANSDLPLDVRIRAFDIKHTLGALNFTFVDPDAWEYANAETVWLAKQSFGSLPEGISPTYSDPATQARLGDIWSAQEKANLAETYRAFEELMRNPDPNTPLLYPQHSKQFPPKRVKFGFRPGQERIITEKP